jgi:hypothetical protein
MTETKATYTFALAPSTEMSAAELRQLKAEYLQRGLEAFTALELIVAVFGSPVVIGKRNYHIWQRGRVTALYHIESERYLSDWERFEETRVLDIFLDCNGLKGLDDPNRVQVCRLRVGDKVIEPEQRFIPGAWLAAMLSEYEAARQIYDQQQAEIHEAERLALIRELMIGADI